MSSSLQGRKKQISLNKKNRRGQSVEVKQRVSFSKQSKNQISVNNIFQQSIKSANQFILSQQSNYRQSAFNLNMQRTRTRDNNQEITEPVNITKPQVYNWEIVKIQQKRKIKGIKAKLMWSKNKQQNWIIIRAVLTDNHIQSNQPQYFVQLDSANVDLNIGQQKGIQKSINKQVEKGHEKSQEVRPQIFYWLKNVLIHCHNLFIGMKINQKKKTKQIQFKRYKINENYILYPCPASLTWSPHGMLCLSQNKVSSLSKPIVGSIYSYRNLIQAPYKFERFARKNNEMNDLKLVDERRQEEQETTQAQFFGWDIKQQINFSILGRSGQQQIQQPRQSTSKSENANQKQQKRIVKDHQTFFMGNTNILPAKVQKIYRRYFTTLAENTQFQFLQKLKIFIVKNQVTQLEDGISYLIDKIQRFNKMGVVQVLLENQFTGYHGVFSKIEKEKPKFQRLKYQIVSQFLQQKIKSTPQSQHFLYMKSMILQNQFFRLALQNYIEENFKKLKILDWKYQKLGIFDNFDQANAEKAIFSILQGYLKPQNNYRNQAKKIKSQYANKPQKYDDPKYRQKKYQKMQAQNAQMKLLLKGYVRRYHKDSVKSQMIESDLKLMKQQSEIDLNKILYKQKIGRNVNLNLLPFLVINKIEFLPLQFNMILTPAQRKSCLESVIPILWIKDRGIQRFQYKIAKRVLIANSKIINFMQKLSSLVNLWKKAQTTKKTAFLKSVINEYHKFQEYSQVPLGKVYYAQCQGCKTEFTAYNIEQLLQVKKCSRCKYLQEVN